MKSVERVFQGLPEHWVGDGFRVSNYFPGASDFIKRMSPFFLLDYHKPFAYTPTSKHRGVGTHPHRGFETVTIAYQGSIAHKDSAGHGGVIAPGEVQWMTAGGGGAAQRVPPRVLLQERRRHAHDAAVGEPAQEA